MTSTFTRFAHAQDFMNTNVSVANTFFSSVRFFINVLKLRFVFEMIHLFLFQSVIFSQYGIFRTFHVSKTHFHLCFHRAEHLRPSDGKPKNIFE